MNEDMKQAIAAQVLAGLKPVLSEINERFEKMDGRFEKLDDRFEKLDDRFEKLERTTRGIALNVAKLNGEMSEVKRSLKEDVASKKDISRLHERIDDFLPAVEASRRDRKMASDAFMGLQRTLDDYGRRITRLEARGA